MSSKRPRTPSMAPGWTVGSIAALGAIFGLLARPAEATLAVYASGTGQNNGVVELSTTVDHTLTLWIDKDGTTSSGNPCSTGQTGDEICGYHLTIEINGSGCFTEFVPYTGYGPEVIHHPPGDALNCTTRKLELAFVDVDTTVTGPVEIGDLTVDAAVATSVEVTGEQIVAADLTLEPVSPSTIAYVPEPGEILLLASGIAGLAGLHRLRRGSLSAR